MKNNIRVRSMIVLLIFIIFSNNVSYGVETTSATKIETRGLTFNTGISSDQIRLLKDFFRAREDANVPWGYNYDNRTKELVRNYQKANGLQADGIAGKSTIDRINKEISDRNLKIGLRTISTDVKGDMIVINKSSNTLYFLKDGRVQESYPVATGKTTSLTPNGKFKIVVKFVNPAWGGAGVSDPIPGGVPENPLGKRWIGISYGGGGKYGVHGNANPRSIGTYASLGCVRMFNNDVERLYDKVKINTPIWIGPEETLQSYGVKFKHDYKVKEVPKKDKVEKKINISLNGQDIKLKEPVINKNGVTYYPFREVLELINAEVIWDSSNGKIIGVLPDHYLEFDLNSNKYRHNDVYKTLEDGQKIFTNNDKTYVPLRVLMENMGYSVGWDQATSKIILNKIN